MTADHPAYQTGYQHRRYTRTERHALHCHCRDSPEESQRSSEARSCRCSEQIGRYHGIPEDALIARSRHRQSAADKYRRNYPRKSGLEQHRLPAGSVAAAHKSVSEYFHYVVPRQRVSADHHGYDCKHRQQYDQQQKHIFLSAHMILLLSYE